MPRLIYSAIASLDGYVEDEQGRFEWAAPDEEVHAFVNALERPIGTYLYGRRMYETMAYWETVDTGPGQRAASREFAEIWRAADKIVYSRTLQAPRTQRTRIVPELDLEELATLKRTAASDLSIGGAELAGQALAAGVVDELQLLLVPVVVGGGRRALPDGVRAPLELVTERRLAGGVVFLSYRIDG